MPRAAAMPTRSPVKLPGPVVTAMRSSAANSSPARSMTRAISGISASAWPRTIGSDSRAEIAALLGVEHGGRAGFERGIDGKDTHGWDYNAGVAMRSRSCPRPLCGGAERMR